MIATAPANARGEKHGFLADVILCAGLLALGVAFRWPELWNIPVFTDEWDEIRVSLNIIRDGAAPLTNADPYYGALTSYLMAGFLWFTGVNMEAPRLFALILGALQLIPTYLLGLEAGRAFGFENHRARLAGVLTGLLLAAAGGHIVLNSHLAWANSTTPLFTTTALWLLLRVARRWPETKRGGWELAAAGLCLGFALQTHIMVLVIMVGVAVGALLTVPRLVFGRWGLLSGIAIMLGYSNMIIFNVLTRGETFRFAQSMSDGYSGGKEVGYLQKLGSLLLSLLRMAGGAIDRRDSFWSFVADPLLIVCITGAFVGVGLLAVRRQTMLLCVLLAAVLLLPFVNNRYEPLFSGRYLSPLLPILFTGLSIVLIVLSSRLVRPRLVPLAAVLMVMVIGGYSLMQLFALYGRLEASGRSNTRVLETMRGIRAMIQPGETVYLDNRLSRRRLMEAGAGDMERVFSALLDASGMPYKVVSIDDGWQPVEPGLVILASRETPRSTGAVIARLRLTQPRGGPAGPMAEGEIFQLYRAAASPKV